MHTREIIFAALQKHYASLQALALDEAEITWKQDTDDLIQPDIAGMMTFKVMKQTRSDCCVCVCCWLE